MTVIFRDFINYSRDCINMILRPAWKLMNLHLSIFTETLAYNTKISEVEKIVKGKDCASGRNSSNTSGDNQAQDNSDDKSSDQEDQDQVDVSGYESDEENTEEEPHGIRGMTLQLIELLTTLVQRPNVQEVVRQGINPL